MFQSQKMHDHTPEAGVERSDGPRIRPWHQRFTAAFIGAIAMAITTPTWGQVFHGFDHTALGQAQLSNGPAGELVISNIGSSGQDGVSIDVGAAAGFSMEIDIGPAGNLAPGSKTIKYVPYTGPGGCTQCEECIEVCEANGGSAALRYMTDDPDVACVTVQLLLGGEVVDERDFPLPFPGAMVTGDLGSDASGNPVTFRVDHGGGGAGKVTFDVLGTATYAITDGGGSTQAETIRFVPSRVSLDGLPPGEPVRVELANHPGGVTIRSEALLLGGEDMDNDGFSEPRVCAALGQAHISGVCGSSVCDVCPECCDPPGGDPLQPVCGVSVSNIGSSGQDGITWKCDAFDVADNIPWDDDIACEMSPITLDQPDETLRFGATGILATSPPGPNQSLGYCELRNRLAVGAVEVFADFSAQGSTEVTVEVYDDGVFQGSAVFPNGGVVGNVGSAAGLPFSWNKCGKLGGTTSCIVACTDDDFVYFGGGQVLTGNDLRVLATGAAAPVEELTSFSILCTDTEDFVCAIESDDDDPQVAVVGGMRGHSLGQAQLQTGADGGLTISNIGSSGQDGVSIDLGEAQGGSMRLARDSFFDIFVDAGECRWRAITDDGDGDGDDDRYLVDARHGPAGSQTTMTLLDGEGQLITSFPYQNDQVCAVETDRAGNTDPPVLNAVVVSTSRSVLELSDSDGGGVRVSHPVGGSHGGVQAMILLNIPSPNPDLVSNMTLRVGADAATPQLLTIEDVGIMQFDNVHTVLGDARVGGDDCDDGDSSTPPDRRLRVSNLGSSGQDGVSIILPNGDQDDDGDGVPDLELSGELSIKVDGVEGKSNDDPYCISMNYENTDNSIGSHAVCVVDDGSGTGAQTVSVDELDLLSPNVIRVRALDANGQVLAEVTGLPSGDVATSSNVAVETITCKMQRVELAAMAPPRMPSPAKSGLMLDSLDAPDEALLLDLPGITNAVYTITVDEPASITLPGQMPVDATELVIAIRRDDGAARPIRRLTSVDVTRAAPAGATVDFGVREEGVKRLAPSCHADCVPPGGNDVVNVDDLFGVINAISTQDHQCDVAPDNGDGTSGNLVVNFDDVLRVIADFGPCP